jgi:hypothetical protein
MGRSELRPRQQQSGESWPGQSEAGLGDASVEQFGPVLHPVQSGAGQADEGIDSAGG